MMGNIGVLGVLICTVWREWADIEFVGYKGYKVLGCDPNDTIVNDWASLKNSITKYLVNQEIDW